MVLMDLFSFTMAISMFWPASYFLCDLVVTSDKPHNSFDCPFQDLSFLHVGHGEAFRLHLCLNIDVSQWLRGRSGGAVLSFHYSSLLSLMCVS